MTPNSYPALILNADFRPMSIFPLPLKGWQDAVTDVILERFDVVAEYDRVVRSPGPGGEPPREMRLPSVLALRKYERRDRPAAFTRAGVLLRAEGKCAYCSTRLTMRDLTFDHVIPQSLGGRTTWENVVASCAPCNSAKANKPLKQSGLTLRHQPYVPTRFHLDEIARENFPLPLSRIHPSWVDHLGLRPRRGATAGVACGAASVFPPGMTSDQYWSVDLDAS